MLGSPISCDAGLMNKSGLRIAQESLFAGYYREMADFTSIFGMVPHIRPSRYSIASARMSRQETPAL
jgi:hypothetical protein